MSTISGQFACPRASFDSDAADEFESFRPRARHLELSRTPTLAPTIAPLGRERRISVAYTGDGTISVIGRWSGREYVFAAGDVREVPLADARYLVTEDDFAFTGGR